MSLPDPSGPRAAAFRSDAVIGTIGAMAGLRNGPALVSLVASLFIGVLVSGLASRLGLAGALLGGLLFLVVAAVGVNAAGLLQLDAARGVAPRRLADAFLAGALCIPRVLLLGVVLLAVALAVFVVLAIVFVVCKLPLIGPLLFLVAFPASVVGAGVALCGLGLSFVLALPAIWQGMTALRALAQALAMLRGRALEVLLSLVLLAVLCAAVAAVIGVVLGVGLVPAVGLSAAILGTGLGSYESMLAITQGYGGASHAIAALLGGGLLWALAVSLIAQVYLRGLVLLQQRTSEGLDADGAEAALRQRLDDVKRRASAWHERARAAALPERNPAPPSFTAPTPASYAGPAPARSVEAAVDDAPEAVAATDPPVAGAAEGRIEPTWGETPMKADDAEAARTVLVDKDGGVEAPDAAAEASPTAAPPAPSTDPSAQPAPTATRPAAKSCPKCAAKVSPQDVFCGVCGQRLR
jgi:hypothetical protein